MPHESCKLACYENFHVASLAVRNLKPETRNQKLIPKRGSAIRAYNLCFLGFGNVNRTLVQLLADRAAELRDRYGITFRITGVASRRLGWNANPEGFDSRS